MTTLTRLPFVLQQYFSLVQKIKNWSSKTQMGSKNPNVAIETWSSKIFAKIQSNQTLDREIERVKESEMEMSEAERESGAVGGERKKTKVR
jgi:hypothetical protein